MLVKTSWEEKSRYSAPWSSQTDDPCAFVTTIGLICAWADQEWKTCFRSSS